MRVAFAAAEAFPFAKVGGLGDVVGSLPRALADRGFDMTVYLPWFEGVAVAAPEVKTAGAVRFSFDGSTVEAPLGVLERDGVRWRFVGLPEFAQGGPYGASDDERRYVQFCMAVAAAVQDTPVDVVHVHDWHTALLAVLMSERSGPRTVLTLHNAAFQGLCDPDRFFAWTDLRRDLLTDEVLEQHGAVSLLKGGIACADRLTTVSPEHARELERPDSGHGVDGAIRARSEAISGVVNGIDLRAWDPANDPHLASGYSPSAPEGKAACERALQQELGLEGPVLGVVTRLSWQKGVDVLLDAVPSLLAAGWSLAVLGQGDPEAVERLRGAVAATPARVAFVDGFDEGLAHRIYAGSAGFLMPSRYEPCGLSQQIAMRYGTPPVAHAVGGLVDTVDDGVTGILFDELSADSLVAAVARLGDLASRRALGAAGMARDASWTRSAQDYGILYEGLREPR